MIVKVYSTQGGEKDVQTSATTWGQLQEDLRKNGVAYDGMKSVVGETKVTLEADAAMLPSEGFTLFLMPKKTKAGVNPAEMGYKALRAEICEILKYTNDTAKAHFNVGKNYTTKSTDELRGLLSSWIDIMNGKSPILFAEHPVTKEEAIAAKEIEVEEAIEEEEEEEAIEQSSDSLELTAETEAYPFSIGIDYVMLQIEEIELPENLLDSELISNFRAGLNSLKSPLELIKTTIQEAVDKVLEAERIAREEKAKEEARIAEEKAEEQRIAEEKEAHSRELAEKEAELRRMFKDTF